MSGHEQIPVQAASTDEAPSPDEIQGNSAGAPVTVVGLGASAGGLEALKLRAETGCISLMLTCKTNWRHAKTWSMTWARRSR